MTDNHPITSPPPHLLKKFSAQAQEETKKRNGAGYLKTFAALCIEWAMNCQSTSNDRQIRSSEIEPPTEVVDQWVALWQDRETTIPYTMWFTQAAQWGADQQLEQDAKWLDTNALFSRSLTITPSGDALRQAMRPKPPSLKEQALAELVDAYDEDKIDDTAYDTIRRALEQLDD